MMHLLRSTFVAAANDSKEILLRNYLALMDSGLEFTVKEDGVVWEYIRDFVRAYGEVPGVNTLKGHFTTIKEDTIVDRLDQLAMAQSLGIGDFLVRLEDKANERRHRVWAEALTEAGHILSQGREIKKGKDTLKLKGPLDSARFVMERVHDVMAPTVGSRLSGEVTGDGADFMNRYERIESDPLAGIGQHTGIFQLDTAINGAKKFELWIHAAFAGGLKSTLMLNWAYNQAVFFLHDVLIFSFEMPYEQDRNILYAMHSMHPKFKVIRHELGLQPNLDSFTCLPYENIRDGTLNQIHPNAKTFLKDYVVPDFNGERVIDGIDPQTKQPWVDPRNYGKIFIETRDSEKSEFTMEDLRHRAETIYSKTPFSMIFIDHVGIMDARKWVPSTTDRQNEIIRDCKKLAMSFNRGQGMAVVTLFQINRDGFKTAMKRKEKTGIAEYDLTSLSYANEAERCVVKSSTYATTSQGMKLVGEVIPGDQVWSSTGWKSVQQVFDNGTRRVWRAVTDRGSILEGTKKHRVRVLQDGTLEWKALGSLTSSDYVVGTFNNINWPVTSPTLHPLKVNAGENPRGKRGTPISTPGLVTDTLAYLLGAWDGDGKVHPKGLGWTGNRKEIAVRDRIRASFEKSFGHPIPVYEHPSRPGSFDMVKWSQPLKRWFDIVAGSRSMAVPKVILQSPRGLVRAYLQGLFDTDGWINNQGIIGINLKIACEPFLREVQMLLTALGIDSDLSFGKNHLKGTGKTYHKVILRIISRTGRERFLTDIGFTEPVKMERLTKWVFDLEGSPKKVSNQVYPVVQTFISAYERLFPKTSPKGGPNRLHTRLRIRGEVPRGRIESLVQYADTNDIGGADIDFLRRILDLHVMRVVSVTDTGRDEPVVDLEVDGDHEYQTGPILSHNSGDIVTASWIDDDLKKMNRAQIQCLKSRDQKPFERFEVRMEWGCRRMLTCMDVSLKPTPMAPGGGASAAVKEAIEKAGKALD